MLDFNVLALELLDYESQELSGKTIFDLIPDLSRNEYSSYIAQIEGRVLTALPASQFLRRDRSNVSAELYMGLTTVDGNRALLTVARDTKERDARELASLIKIGSVINESPEIADVYEEFASVANELVQFDRMTICEIYEDDLLSPVHVSGMKVKGWEPGTLHHLDETVMRPAVKDRSSLLVETRILRERIGDGTSADAGINSSLVVPLVTSNQLVGLLTVSSTAEDAYFQEDLSRLERIGQQIAGVIANSKLYEKSQRASHERAIIAKIGRIISSSTDINDIYAQFVSAVHEVLESDRTIIAEIDLDRRTYTPVYVNGIAVEGSSKGLTRPLDGTVIAQVVDVREALLLDKKATEALTHTYPDMARRASKHLYSHIVVPLISKDEVIGMFTLSSTKDSCYDDRDMDLAQQVAAQISGAVANAQLLGKIRMEARDRKVIAEIGRVVSSSLDISDVWQSLDEQIRSVLPCDRFAMVELDPTEKALVAVYQTGVTVPGADVGEPQRLTEEEWRVFSEETSSIRMDRSQMEKQADSSPGIKKRLDAGLFSHASVPVVTGDTVVARFAISSSHDNAYTDSDTNLLLRIATQVAPAFINSRLHQQTIQLGNEQAAIAAIGATIASTLEIDEVYDEVASQLHELIPFDHLVVSTVDQERNELVRKYVAGLNVPGWESGQTLRLADFSKESVVFTGISRLTSQTETGRIADLNPAEAAALAFGFLSQIVVPLSSGGEIIGVMTLRSKSEDTYTTDDLEIAQRIAEQFAPAIKNARLLEASKKESQDRTAIAEIGRAVASERDLAAVMSTAANAVQKLIPYDRFTVSIVDDADPLQLRLLHISGIRVPSDQDGIIYRSQDSPWSKHHWIRANEDPEKLEAGLKLWMEVTIGQSIESPIGYLSFQRREGRDFNAADLDLASLVANQIAPAIKNAQLLEQIRVTTAQEERNRLARDLHDSVAQSLYSVTLYSEATDRYARAGDLERVRANLDQLGESALQALREMRLLVHQLRPRELEKEGLISALQHRLDAVEGRSKIQTRLTLDREYNLPAKIENVLYPIALEALNNIIKHSHASVVEIRVNTVDGGVELTVEDNGRGFEIAEQSAQTGVGLSSMNERLRGIGGTLSVTSTVGEGTTVRAFVEIDSPDPEPSYAGQKMEDTNESPRDE